MPRGRMIRPRDSQRNLTSLTGLQSFLSGGNRLRRHSVTMRLSHLDVEVLDVQRIIFNELATSLDVFSHQGGENRFRFSNVFKLD